MNKQRKVLITITYNEMGIIIDTKTEELGSSAQPEKRTKERTETHARDSISRQQAIEAVKKHYRAYDNDLLELIIFDIERLPSAQPETATVTIGRTNGGVTMWYECDACGEPIDQKDCYCRKCGRKLKHE